MNKKILLTTIIIPLLMAGCGKIASINTLQQNKQLPLTVATTISANINSSKVITPTATIKSGDAIDYTAMQTYKTVLQNKTEFFNTDYKKNQFLNDFLTNNGVYDTTFKLKNFAVLDMDGDKIPEVVLELAPGNYVEFYEVLHYVKGEVYGYIFGIRSFGDIKADGTFGWSGSAFYNGYGKLRFQSDGSVTTDNIGYHNSENNNGVVASTFFVNNQPVTERVYQSFENEQQGKKEVTWYEFSQENIETVFSNN